MFFHRPYKVRSPKETYAHAIERVTGYAWRHGEAVAVGCVFAAEVARALGRLDPAVVALHRQALSAAGLPVSFEQGADRFEEVLAVPTLVTFLWFSIMGGTALW